MTIQLLAICILHPGQYENGLLSADYLDAISGESQESEGIRHKISIQPINKEDIARMNYDR